MDNSRPTYIDAQTFQREFSLSARIFFLWIKEGKLQAYKPSRRKTLVRRSDVLQLIESSKVGANLDAPLPRSAA